MDYLLTSFKGVGVTFGILAVQTGVHALWRPLSFAENFGLPLNPKLSAQNRPRGEKDHAAKSVDFGPAYTTMMGARQAGTGVIILIFASCGKWMEIATVLSVVGLLCATTDAYNLWKGGKNGHARFHALPGLAIAAHALAVLYRNGGL
ncbi:unnamed protein product [Periconia digitata]|uniref:Uncharacterized protein n=1 Tax=Periconia digitata TaxID=1303443 RepID=A0A9W4XSF1_9PLEO|nr:unnamed protein product [Periconia digitata]